MSFLFSQHALGRIYTLINIFFLSNNNSNNIFISLLFFSKQRFFYFLANLLIKSIIIFVVEWLVSASRRMRVNNIDKASSPWWLCSCFVSTLQRQLCVAAMKFSDVIWQLPDGQLPDTEQIFEKSCFCSPLFQVTKVVSSFDSFESSKKIVENLLSNMMMLISFLFFSHSLSHVYFFF